VEVHERLDGESGQRWAHGDSTAQEKALNADPNSVGFTPPLPDSPRFPRPGSAAVDTDGLAGSPAEMIRPDTPAMEPVPTAGEPLSPSAAVPASAAWAEELADARQGAQQMMDRLTPATAVDPFAGFKAHRQLDSGMFESIPGGSEVAQGDEVQTVDEMTRPGSAAALRGTPRPPAPNTQGPMGASSVVEPSMRAISPADVEAAGS